MSTIEYLRSFRLYDFAVFDFATAYLGIYLLVPILNKIIAFTSRQLTRWQWMLLVLPIAIVFHLLTANMTPLTKLAIDPYSGYLFKAALLAMLYFGLRKP